MKNGFLCALVLVAISYLRAEEPRIDSAKSNTAILLNIVDLNLEGFNGGIGFKYWIGETYTVKFGLDFSYSDKRQSNPTSYDEKFSLNKSIGFTVDIERHIYVKEELSLYFGLGGGITLGANRSDDYVASNPTPGVYGIRTYSNIFKANLLFGAEYSLNKTFSLSFQQTLTGSYTFEERDDLENEYGRRYDTEYYSASMGSSSLMLLIYL
ncbi:MAG TPA: hypothetical protein VHP30_07740 [Ignavibacteriales bacterium]|nr:hypothetical protein [Ignavibacteriales bacterium]